MSSFKDKFRRFMVGRYGTDELNRFLSCLVAVFIVVNLFVRSGMFFWLELLCVIVVYFRMFSKNTTKRFYENQAYLQWSFHAAEGLKKAGRRLQERRKFKIFKCPDCGQKLRIPRGHGNIQIHCRRCGKNFMGKS